MQEKNENVTSAPTEEAIAMAEGESECTLFAGDYVVMTQPEGYEPTFEIYEDEDEARYVLQCWRWSRATQLDREILWA